MTGDLHLEHQPAAAADSNPQDNVVDWRFTVVHDPATHSWTETLALGVHPDDVDGLVQVPKRTGPPTDPLILSVLGSVLILAPIIGIAVGATDPNSASSYSMLAGTIIGAAAIGAAGVLRTEKITRL